MSERESLLPINFYQTVVNYRIILTNPQCLRPNNCSCKGPQQPVYVFVNFILPLCTLCILYLLRLNSLLLLCCLEKHCKPLPSCRLRPWVSSAGSRLHTAPQSGKDGQSVTQLLDTQILKIACLKLCTKLSITMIFKTCLVFVLIHWDFTTQGFWGFFVF